MSKKDFFRKYIFIKDLYFIEKLLSDKYIIYTYHFRGKAKHL